MNLLIIGGAASVGPADLPRDIEAAQTRARQWRRR